MPKSGGARADCAARFSINPGKIIDLTCEAVKKPHFSNARLELGGNHSSDRLIGTMGQKDRFRFSVTVLSDDLPVIAAMCGLAWFCQPEICRQTAVFRTTEDDWKRDSHHVTFHYTSEGNRQSFITESKRSFLGSWEITNQKSNDPPR